MKCVKEHSNAPGYPSRSGDLDAKPGFQSPPIGYGEVPFWWWSGEDLDLDRLLWQVRELHAKGVSGVQVNYSSYDTPGWAPDTGDPAIFSDEWWKVYSRVSEECAKLDMGIGLSTYSIDSPKGAKNLFYELFYSKPELNALELVAGKRVRVEGGQECRVSCAPRCFAARAYEVQDGVLQRGGVDLTELTGAGPLVWAAPAGEWEIWTFGVRREEISLNPLMEGAGDLVIQDFYQKFQDHNPGKTAKGLNYFFNDELQIGLGKYDFENDDHVIGDGKLAWNPDFPAEFLKRKGYDIFEVLPAMWEEMGDITPKLRIDYADVRMSLMEERYFEPIYNWHASRGMIFGCDQSSRGTQPNEFGDYFRATRWYSAPGHDTPGGQADLLKGKVSSSIANLYQRPRVWLEGYHSLGWGAAPERLMHATCENFLYGCTLLNLHGLYYTTYGSHWEWAPPCYHFRMPYWDHMGAFLKYFERLSYLMSQGHHVCDVAVMYPVTPYEAQLNGDTARDTAFELAEKLMAAGIDFDFIDHQSLSRAEVKEGRLVVGDAKASYQGLVFPSMEAVRWASVEKAAAFAENGGTVIAVGALPSVTDRAGRNDPKLVELNDMAFKPESRLRSADEAVEIIRAAFVQDLRGLNGYVRTLHRRIGPRDVYLVMDANPGDVVEFRAKGAVELWDPWTGESSPLRVVEETTAGTQVELTLEAHQAQVIVFTPTKAHLNPMQKLGSAVVVKTLPSIDWNVCFETTMNNSFGDFRLPVTAENITIGVEARRFAWARENEVNAETAMLPKTDDSNWRKQLHGYGTQFYRLGPVPDSLDAVAMDAELAKLTQIDPAVPVIIEGESYTWQPYDFSWRYGKEGDPGHQGWHGLKGSISDDFIRLGKADLNGNGVLRLAPQSNNRTYLWTTATVEEPTVVTIHAATDKAADMPNTSPVIAPSVVIINGSPVTDLEQPVSLNAGSNPMLIRYDNWGQSHLVLRRQDSPLPAEPEQLAMRWYKDPGVIPFDPQTNACPAEWFRFRSAPGTTAIQLQTESREPVQAWIDGEPMIAQGNGSFAAQNPLAKSAVVALRLVPPMGQCGGAAIPEPITIATNGQGVMPLGDWSKFGILNNYSGGVRYQKQFTLTQPETEGALEIDLGRVSATAEVRVNGKNAGIRVAPPWKLDVSGLLQAGENKIEVLVYNTLANHYQTIPSQYKGDPISGLFGPVTIFKENIGK